MSVPTKVRTSLEAGPLGELASLNQDDLATEMVVLRARLAEAEAQAAEFTHQRSEIMGLHLPWVESSGAQGQQAVLSDLILSGEDLQDVNLAGADFSGANLTDADFTNATVPSVNFFRATVAGTNFGGVDLSTIRPNPTINLSQRRQNLAG